MAESYYFSTEKHDNIHLAKNFLMLNTLFFFFLLILKINYLLSIDYFILHITLMSSTWYSFSDYMLCVRWSHRCYNKWESFAWVTSQLTLNSWVFHCQKGNKIFLRICIAMYAYILCLNYDLSHTGWKFYLKRYHVNIWKLN